MTENTAPKIVVITGPTATGKTSLSISLAKSLNGEIVSADSMQIYRNMDIGTAKVTAEEAQGVPHYMVDIAEPEDTYSVARYVSEADKRVQDIISRQKLPIIVGGTGLYIDSLVAGRDYNDKAFDANIRQELEEQYAELGGEEMLRRLSEFDPQRANKLHPADRKRILRAFEYYEITGQTITAHDIETQNKAPRYDAIKIALSFKNREDLYNRINLRVDKMDEAGLFDEVSSLLKSGISDSCTSMQAIGYKEAALYLRGELSKEEALDKIKRESRRYAKRQLTWLRRDKKISWILWDKTPNIEKGRLHSTEIITSLC